MRKLQGAVARVTILAMAMCAGCGSWPPVVVRVADVEALPIDQRDIRCIGCDDQVLAMVGHRLTQLDYLFINDESHITDHGVQALTGLRRLRQLEIENGSMLTDASVRAIKQLAALRELSINRARMISEDGLLDLLDGSRLQRLFMFDAQNINTATLGRMRERLPRADIRVAVSRETGG